MAWTLLGTETLVGTSSTLSTSVTSKKFNLILESLYPSGVIGTAQRLGVTTLDTGSNYATRGNYTGGSDYTSTNGTSIDTQLGGATTPIFMVGFWINIASEEKLFIGWGIYQATAGAGTDPRRREIAGKWTNTSNQFDIVGDPTSTGSWAANTNLTVIGTD